MHFAGEAFLASDLPDPDVEAQLLKRRLTILFVVVMFVAPAVLGRLVVVSTTSNNGITNDNKNDNNNNNNNKEKKDVEEEDEDDSSSSLLLLQMQRRLRWINLIGVIVGLGMIIVSPHHLFTGRSVFIAPLLTPSECQSIIQRSHQAATRNLLSITTTRENNDNNNNNNENDNEFASSLQRQPQGWQKTRHEHYPTIDLNWVTDPFMDDDRKYLGKILDNRLGPLIHRIYGMVPSSIRANDIFIVRYDASTDEDGGVSVAGQQSLRPHTDESFVSFNILLNNNFQGGGTRFHNRRKRRKQQQQTITTSMEDEKQQQSYLDVHPAVGDVLINNAVILHEGLTTTNGTRYILVGFLSVDDHRSTTTITSLSSGRSHPTKKTGLSWFASWLYLPWLQVRMKQGYQAIAQRQQQQQQQQPQQSTSSSPSSSSVLLNDLTYLWYNGMSRLIEFMGDILAPHKVHWLVHPRNATRYLSALDHVAAATQQAAAREATSTTTTTTSSSRLKKASWFEQQRLITDASGRVVRQVESSSSSSSSIRSSLELSKGGGGEL